MNIHRNDVWRTDGLPCEKHFQNPGHYFNAHAKFTIIEEVYNKSLSKLEIRSLLEHREDFWILKSQTLSPQHLIISLNYPQDTTRSIWYSYQCSFPHIFLFISFFIKNYHVDELR